MGDEKPVQKNRNRRGSLDAHWREKIQTTAILTRLSKHTMKADGDLMTASQIRAAEILLRKVIPDLKSVSMTGESGGPLLVEVVIAPHAEVSTLLASAVAADDDDDDDAEDTGED